VNKDEYKPLEVAGGISVIGRILENEPVVLKNGIHVHFIVIFYCFAWLYGIKLAIHLMTSHSFTHANFTSKYLPRISTFHDMFELDYLYHSTNRRD